MMRESERERERERKGRRGEGGERGAAAEGGKSSMPPTWLRIDSVVQTVGSEAVLCEVSLADDTRADSIDLCVDAEQLCLRSRHDSAPPVTIRWPSPVQGDKAAARLIRRRRMLVVRAPLAPDLDAKARRYVRATVRALGRGSLVLRLPLALAAPAPTERVCVLASRRGAFPSLEARDYGWCATYSKEEAADPSAHPAGPALACCSCRSASPSVHPAPTLARRPVQRSAVAARSQLNTRPRQAPHLGCGAAFRGRSNSPPFPACAAPQPLKSRPPCRARIGVGIAQRSTSWWRHSPMAPSHRRSRPAAR